jgi:hypothetical protein
MSQTQNILNKSLFIKLNSIFDLTSLFEENSPAQLYIIDQYRNLTLEYIEKKDAQIAQICYTFTDKTGMVIESSKFNLQFNSLGEEIQPVDNQNQDSQLILAELNEILKPVKI